MHCVESVGKEHCVEFVGKEVIGALCGVCW